MELDNIKRKYAKNKPLKSKFAVNEILKIKTYSDNISNLLILKVEFDTKINKFLYIISTDTRKEPVWIYEEKLSKLIME